MFKLNHFSPLLNDSMRHDVHVPEGFSVAELQASHGKLSHTEGLVFILELNSKSSTLRASFQPDKLEDLICELPFLSISVFPFELQQSVDTCDDGKASELCNICLSLQIIL